MLRIRIAVTTAASTLLAAAVPALAAANPYTPTGVCGAGFGVIDQHAITGPAPGRCVIYGGRMRDAKGNGGSWITPRFGHCG